MKNFIIIRYFFIIILTTITICAKVNLAENILNDKQQIVTVNTIAELVTIDTTQTTFVRIQGYSSLNDGGEGFFTYVPAKSNINNGGTILNGWVRNYSGAVNVKWFGAKSDGSNAVKNIQSAIDSGAKEIYVPAGTYRLDGKKLKRILHLRSDLRLYGEAGTVFDFSNNPAGEHHSVTESYIAGQGEIGEVHKITSTALRGKDSVKSTSDDIVSGDLVLIYSDDTVDEKQAVRIGELIYVESIMDNGIIILETVLSDNYMTNPKIAKVKALENITIENIKIIGSGRAKPGYRSDLGIVIQYGKNIQIRNCEFNFVDNTGVDLESVIDFTVENNIFRFEKKGENKTIQYGIKYSNASRDGYIVGNNIYNGKHAIVQGHTVLIPGISRNIIVSGNNISGTWHAGIVVHASGNTITITGNQLRGCNRGIESRIPNMSITNNILSDIKTHAIMIKDASENIIVSGNIINRCGSNGIHVYNLKNSTGNISIANNIVYDANGGVIINAKSLTDLITGISIDANIFRKLKTHGITTVGNISVNITGNRLSNIEKNAIYLRGNRFGVINANSIAKAKIAFRLDAETYAVDNLVISNNTVTGTQRFMSKTSIGSNIIFANNVDNSKRKK